VVEELDHLIFEISFETQTSQEFCYPQQQWNSTERSPMVSTPMMEDQHTCPVNANLHPPDVVPFSSEFFPTVPNTAKLEQLGVGGPFHYNSSPSDRNGCYRDETAPIEETDPVIKALSLDNEQKNHNPLVSQLSYPELFDEDSRISLLSLDGGYVSETPNNQNGAEFFVDSVCSPGFPLSFSVPPSRSVSSVTPEPSTPYPVYPSPASSYQSGDDSHFDYHHVNSSNDLMLNYPSSRMFSSMYSWGESQIAQHLPPTHSYLDSVCSPCPLKSVKGDQKYKERRDKNNKASRVSRKRKRQKIEALEDQEKTLALENEKMKKVITAMEMEIAQVREQLVKHLSNK
jgi:hypothetical protein